MKKIYVLGGGTFNYVRTHLALAVPAFGQTAWGIYNGLMDFIRINNATGYSVTETLTKMANPKSYLTTNDDVELYLNSLISDPETKGIFFNVALCDFEGTIDELPSGKHATRLKSREGRSEIVIRPSKKLLPIIREKRKDIFVVGFKATSNATVREQYLAALQLIKESSINLVLANDVVTRRNIIVVPEEAWYDCGTIRSDALQTLVKMFMARQGLTYTRSTVVPGESVLWNSDVVPSSLRTVVDYCIAEGAYKPFLGKTAGHFAFKVDDKTFVTSKRKVNFNDLNTVGLVKVTAEGPDKVIAYGAKPSVGGQSQRIIFNEHKDMDCIVHFHCPPKINVPTREQWPFECGSHQCGRNTSNGLREVAPGIKAVYLDKHGPNIVFNRNIDPNLVINYINETFDLKDKTGGLVS